MRYEIVMRFSYRDNKESISYLSTLNFVSDIKHGALNLHWQFLTLKT